MRWIIKTQRANLTADAPGWALTSNDAIRATGRESERGRKIGSCFISHRKKGDFFKFFWHFNVMNPYTRLIRPLHVMRRHTWTAYSCNEWKRLRLESIIRHMSYTTRLKKRTEQCLVSHLPISPFCVFKVFPHNVCVCVKEWERYRAESVPGPYRSAGGSVSFSHCGHWIGQKFNTKKSAAHPVLTKAICNMDLSRLPTKPAAVFTI